MLCARALETWFGELSATSRRLALGREVRARLPPPGRTRPFSARSVESSSPPCPHATQPVRLLPYWDVSAIFVLPSPSRRVCSAPRRRGSPSRTNTLRPGGARRDPRCESVGGARVLALSGTAAGAQRAQIRPTRVKEGGSDTAKRCFRGPHELAFIRSKIFIYPQFASSALQLVPTNLPGNPSPTQMSKQDESRTSTNFVTQK